jgi:putative ABC transport system permease protein
MTTNQFGPIFRALMKTRLGAALIVLQIALTLAIVSNMLPIVGKKIAAALRPSGVSDAQLFAISSLTTLEAKAAVKEDLTVRHARERAVIMGIAGVENATISNTFSNSNSGWSNTVRTTLERGGGTNSALYMADEHAIATLGAKLIAGRNFDAREILVATEGVDIDPKQTIITESLAKQLFGEETALGKRMTFVGDAKVLNSEIIGIVSDVARPWPGFGNYYDAAFLPYRVPGFAQWIVRVKPGSNGEQVAQAVASALAKADRSVVYGARNRSFTKARHEAYADHLLIAGLLASFSLLVLIVTALGIVGLASFWITQRTRQIGVRRALGAKASEILWYFRQENFLLTGLGVVFGVMLAYGLNFALTKQLGAEKLPLFWVCASAVGLLALGQLAVTAPARRAARIAPSLATRS